jgi:hypothetical protein
VSAILLSTPIPLLQAKKGKRKADKMPKAAAKSYSWKKERKKEKKKSKEEDINRSGIPDQAKQKYKRITYPSIPISRKATTPL